MEKTPFTKQLVLIKAPGLLSNCKWTTNHNLKHPWVGQMVARCRCTLAQIYSCENLGRQSVINHQKCVTQLLSLGNPEIWIKELLLYLTGQFCHMKFCTAIAKHPEKMCSSACLWTRTEISLLFVLDLQSACDVWQVKCRSGIWSHKWHMVSQVAYGLTSGIWSHKWHMVSQVAYGLTSGIWSHKWHMVSQVAWSHKWHMVSQVAWSHKQNMAAKVKMSQWQEQVQGKVCHLQQMLKGRKKTNGVGGGGGGYGNWRKKHPDVEAQVQCVQNENLSIFWKTYTVGEGGNWNTRCRLDIAT